MQSYLIIVITVISMEITIISTLVTQRSANFFTHSLLAIMSVETCF